MAVTPIQPPPSAIPPARTLRPRWLMPVLCTVAGVIVLVIGVGIGVASQQSKINSYKHQTAQLQDQLTTTKGSLSATHARLTTAQTDAHNAMSTALTQVKAQYQAKFAALQAQEQRVAGMRAKLNRELGVVQASTISQDGVYVVGKDIPAGVYHTSGAGANSQPGGACYFATLNSTNTEDISDNNNFNGPETVDVTGAYAFQISGGCIWHKIG
jgi:hypothetical protein